MTATSEWASHTLSSPQRRSSRTWLLTMATLLWIEAWIGTAVAVHKKLAYGFGGHGHPGEVWGDFVSGGGTALSPPLPIMIVLAVMILLATRRGWIGIIGVVGLTLLAILSLVAIVGEPLARRVLAPSRIAFPETALVIGSLLGASLMFLLAVGNLVALYRERSTETGPSSASAT